MLKALLTCCNKGVSGQEACGVLVAELELVVGSGRLVPNTLQRWENH